MTSVSCPALVEAFAAWQTKPLLTPKSLTSLDQAGRPSFTSLQIYGSFEAANPLYVFDVLFLGGREVMGETLNARRSLLERRILTKLAEPVRYAQELRGASRI